MYLYLIHTLVCSNMHTIHTIHTTCTHTCAHAHTYTHTCMYTHTHIHVRMSRTQQSFLCLFASKTYDCLLIATYTCWHKATVSVDVFLSFSFQRASEPPQVNHERLMVVSVAGFIVNLVGIFVFHHGGMCC